jgi:hypothetical protein
MFAQRPFHKSSLVVRWRLAALAGAAFLGAPALLPFATEAQNAPPPPATERKGPPVDSITSTYRNPGTDPFFDSTKVRGPRTPPPSEIEYPSFAEREVKWREIRDRRLDQGLTPPDDSEKYLVDEFEVKGIFSTGKGLGALLKDKKNGTTIFVREGSKFWNGAVTKIDRSARSNLDAGFVGQVLCSEIVVLTNGQIKTKQRALQYIPKKG